MNKYLSRKFLISLAAFLGSIGASITGMVTDNKTLATVGVVCTVLSAGIYAACESYVDGQSASTSQTITTNTSSNAEQKVTTIKTTE